MQAADYQDDRHTFRSSSIHFSLTKHAITQAPTNATYTRSQVFKLVTYTALSFTLDVPLAFMGLNTPWQLWPCSRDKSSHTKVLRSKQSLQKKFFDEMFSLWLFPSAIDH